MGQSRPLELLLLVRRWGRYRAAAICVQIGVSMIGVHRTAICIDVSVVWCSGRIEILIASSNAICVAVCVPVSITVVVVPILIVVPVLVVTVRVPVAFGLVIVGIRGALVHAFGLRFFLDLGRGGRRFAFLRRAAQVNRDRLTDLNLFARIRNLDNDCVWLGITDGPDCAHAKIKVRRFDRILGRGAILAHDVRNFRLRAVQGKDDGAKQAHRESDGNQDDNENSLERQKGAVDECHEGLSFYPGARQKGRKRNGEV